MLWLSSYPALSDVNTIGSLYTIKKGLPAVSIPSVNIDMIMTLLPDALTIAVLARYRNVFFHALCQTGYVRFKT